MIDTPPSRNAAIKWINDGQRVMKMLHAMYGKNLYDEESIYAQPQFDHIFHGTASGTSVMELDERELSDGEARAVKKMVEKMKDGSAKPALKKKFGKDWVSAAFGIATNVVKKRTGKGNEPHEPLTKPVSEAYKEENVTTSGTARKTAATILAQFGGKRFILMTGAKDLSYGTVKTGDYLQFRLPIGKSNLVRIVYDRGRDLYNAEFYNRGRISMKSPERDIIKPITSAKGIDVEQMVDVFQKTTGLRVSLGSLGR